MQELSSENQWAEASEERFADISETELNLLLESRHSKATKKSTNWAVKTFKGRYQNILQLLNISKYLLQYLKMKTCVFT